MTDKTLGQVAHEVIERMNSGKSLGQVAFEAKFSYPRAGMGDEWSSMSPLMREFYERAAQAVAENVRQQCMKDVYEAMPDGYPYELSDVIAAWRHGERP